MIAINIRKHIRAGPASAHIPLKVRNRMHRKLYTIGMAEMNGMQEAVNVVHALHKEDNEQGHFEGQWNVDVALRNWRPLYHTHTHT